MVAGTVVDVCGGATVVCSFVFLLNAVGGVVCLYSFVVVGGDVVLCLNIVCCLVVCSYVFGGKVSLFFDVDGEFVTACRILFPSVAFSPGSLLTGHLHSSTEGENDKISICLKMSGRYELTAIHPGVGCTKPIDSAIQCGLNSIQNCMQRIIFIWWKALTRLPTTGL